jgi:hypothetical protein
MSGGEEVISLLYDDYEDCLIDPDGRPFLDTLNIISPGRFRYMKRVRGVEYVKGVKAGIVYELISSSYFSFYLHYIGVIRVCDVWHNNKINIFQKKTKSGFA